MEEDFFQQNYFMILCEMALQNTQVETQSNNKELEPILYEMPKPQFLLLVFSFCHEMGS